MWRRDGEFLFQNGMLTPLSEQARSVAPVANNIASKQARSYADKASPTEVSSILEQRIRGVAEEASLAETGRVLSVGYVRSTIIRLISLI